MENKLTERKLRSREGVSPDSVGAHHHTILLVVFRRGGETPVVDAVLVEHVEVNGEGEAPVDADWWVLHREYLVFQADAFVSDENDRSVVGISQQAVDQRNPSDGNEDDGGLTHQ